MQVLETADGPLPEAALYYYERFGGLPIPALAPSAPLPVAPATAITLFPSSSKS